MAFLRHDLALSGLPGAMKVLAIPACVVYTRNTSKILEAFVDVTSRKCYSTSEQCRPVFKKQHPN